MNNFSDYGVTSARVKWYDRYNRLFSKTFASLDTARDYYKSICSGNDCPLYAQLMANTIEGPIVLREYRPS